MFVVMCCIGSEVFKTRQETMMIGLGAGGSALIGWLWATVKLGVVIASVCMCVVVWR